MVVRTASQHTGRHGSQSRKLTYILHLKHKAEGQTGSGESHVIPPPMTYFLHQGLDLPR